MVAHYFEQPYKFLGSFSCWFDAKTSIVCSFTAEGWLTLHAFPINLAPRCCVQQGATISIKQTIETKYCQVAIIGIQSHHLGSSSHRHEFRLLFLPSELPPRFLKKRIEASSWEIKFHWTNLPTTIRVSDHRPRQHSLKLWHWSLRILMEDGRNTARGQL